MSEMVVAWWDPPPRGGWWLLVRSLFPLDDGEKVVACWIPLPLHNGGVITEALHLHGAVRVLLELLARGIHHGEHEDHTHQQLPRKHGRGFAVQLAPADHVLHRVQRRAKVRVEQLLWKHARTNSVLDLHSRFLIFLSIASSKKNENLGPK